MASEILNLLEKKEEQPSRDRDNTIFAIECYLDQFLIHGKGLYNLSHDYVRSAVRQKFKLENDEKQLMEAGIAVHQTLAAYFTKQCSSSNSSDSMTVTRLMRELTYHERRANLRPCVLIIVRCRPLHDRDILNINELNKSRQMLVEPSRYNICQMKGKLVKILSPTEESEPKFYKFDMSLNGSTQQKVYSLCCENIVIDALEGNNSSLFGYGPTGSGKTYSIFGDESNPGLIPNLAKDLFSKIHLKESRYKSDGTHYKCEVKCAMIEIYKEKLYDLLDDRTELCRKDFEVILSSPLPLSPLPLP
jgi:hypothetical protein